MQFRRQDDPTQNPQFLKFWHTRDSFFRDGRDAEWQAERERHRADVARTAAAEMRLTGGDRLARQVPR